MINVILLYGLIRSWAYFVELSIASLMSSVILNWILIRYLSNDSVQCFDRVRISVHELDAAVGGVTADSGM